MACPKGTRIAAWWEGGELGPCVIHTSLDRGTSKGCLRCDFHDTKADNGELLSTELSMGYLGQHSVSVGLMSEIFILIHSSEWICHKHMPHCC